MTEDAEKSVFVSSKEYEVLILRNACFKQLYDVVRVDFFKEEIEYLAKGIDFVDAVVIVEEFENEIEHA
jgi:hypothetical protein